MIPAPAPDDWMGSPSGLDLPSAAALQDEMLTVSHDLWRLRSMLGSGLNQLTEQLIDAFGQTADLGDTAPEKADALRETLKKAVTSLQIQDMAEQLVDHMQTRLNRCADLVAEAMLGDGPIVAPPPLRPSPVARDDRDGGSVELF
jgi:hypothetical protein